MPDPRTIALQKNGADKFEDVEQGYDSVGGCPKNQVPDQILEEARPSDPTAGKEPIR